MVYKYRYLQENLHRKIADLSILLITGARRSGKSTLAKKLLSEWGGTTYYSFDTPVEQAVLKSDPQLFIQNLEFPVVLDEIQNVPEIFPYLKLIVDQKEQDGIQIILTGSQSFEMMKNIKESLAGRILIKELLPFLSAEAVEIDAKLIQNNFQALIEGQELNPINANRSYQQLNQAILSGGYPPIWELTDSNHKVDWYNSYCQTYVERDVRSLINVKDLAMYQKFISLVAHRSAKLVNYSELGKDISVNYKTSKNYLSILKASYIWTSLKAYDKNIEKRLVKAAKGIFIDSGLCCFLNGINNEVSLARSANKDFLFETWMISELIKLSKIFNTNLKFYHYRRSNNFEVDLIIEEAGRVIPIEIKNSANIKTEWTRGIKDLIEQTGKTYAGYGYIISRYDQAIELAPGIKNIPISYFTGVK